jgi:glycerol-3-phosphate acyltransferase PlsX
MSLIEKGNLLSAAYVLLKLKKDISRRGNPEQYNGAALLGFNGNIIKGHGSSTEKAIYYGIRRTADISRSNLNSKIEEALSKYSLD